MTQRTRAGAASALFLLLFFLSAGAIACDCPPVPQLNKSECGKFNVIVRGVIEKVDNCSAVISVKELYKGNIASIQEFYFDCTTDCSMSFIPGEEWLLYLKGPKDKLMANICDRNRKFFANDKDDFYTPALQLSYEAELVFLKINIGLTQAENSNVKGQVPYHDITARSNQLSDRWKTIGWLAASFLLFGLIYYLFNKFVK